MTSGFEYGPDGESVTARVSIDVPTDGIQSLRDIASAVHQVGVEMEATSRMTGSFLEYLKQLPQIQSQVIQAQKLLATQLERTTEAEQRLKAGGIGGVPTGTYEQPWSGVSSGMGGRPPSMSDMSYQLGNLDTRTLYMMNNERPGGLRPGDMNPQVSSDEALTQAAERTGAREAAQTEQVTKHPAAGKGGGLGKGALGGLAAKSKMVQKLTGPVMKELAGGATIEGLLSALGTGLGGGEGLAGFMGGSGALGAAGPVGAALAAAGAGLGLFEKGGNVVEGWRKMGQERGGGWHEGAKNEGQIMTLALNPFITMEQARKIVQGGLSEGYSGKEFETVTGFVAGNLQKMNVDITDSFKLMRKNIFEGGSSKESTEGTLAEMSGLSKSGYMNMQERLKEFVPTSESMINAGYTGDQANQFALNAQQMFAGNKTLRGMGSSLAQGTTSNPMTMMMASRMEGIAVPPGTLPGAYGLKLSEMGIDPTKVGSDFLKTLAQRAQQASGGDDDNGAAMFQIYVKKFYPDLKSADGTLVAEDITAAQKLYLEYVGGGGDPYQSANQTAGKGHQAPPARTPSRHPAPSPAGRIPSATPQSGHGMQVVSGQGEVQEYTGDEGQREALSSGGSRWRYNGDQGPGTSLARTPNTTVNNHYYDSPGGAQSSHVQGTLNITVNPSEFQRALGVPQQVSLSPNEVQANQGYRTAQRNTPPPGYGR